VGRRLRRWLLRRAAADGQETAAEVVARFTDDPALRAVLGRGLGLTLVHFSAQRKRFPWDRGWV